jgi:FkbM family methyltransferase
MDTVLADLESLARSVPRFKPGEYAFPFGTLQYVDAFTLPIQYKEIFLDGLYDYETSSTSPLILDCGGNIGLSVIRYKQRHPSSRVVVFEADPNICAVLRSNLQAMGFHDIEIVEAAAWINDGFAAFVVEGAEGGHLGVDGNITVPTVRFARWFEEPVDLLKLDIEGGEWRVLEDLLSSGAMRTVENAIIELHGRSSEGGALGRILQGLDESGFSFTFPWSFCEPGLFGAAEPTPFPYVTDAKYISFVHAWRRRPDV